jgi:hypothetical protein
LRFFLTLRAATDQKLFNGIGKVLPRIEEKMEAQRQARQQTQQQASKGSKPQLEAEEGLRAILSEIGRKKQP